jgi:hypothetical protein
VGQSSASVEESKASLYHFLPGKHVVVVMPKVLGYKLLFPSYQLLCLDYLSLIMD